MRVSCIAFPQRAPVERREGEMGEGVEGGNRGTGRSSWEGVTLVGRWSTT